MSDPVCDALKKKLSEDITRYTEDICSGAVDFAAYKHQCGVLRGLTLALEHVEDLAKKVEGNLNDD